MALRQRWETRSVRNNKKVRRDEKVGREGRLRQELQLHTAKQKSLNKLYSAPSPACYVISLRRLMADREIPVSSIILAGHASTKRARLSRILTKNFLSLTLFPEGENLNFPLKALLIAIDKFSEGLETVVRKMFARMIKKTFQFFEYFISNISPIFVSSF